jgi:hypothetical protein
MTLNSKEKNETLYVRGIKSSNIKFLNEITRAKGFRYVKEYLNNLLDRQRQNHENRKKQLKENQTIKRRL